MRTLSQIHEVEHFLQYNNLYCGPKTLCEEEFKIDAELRQLLESYIDENKLGYKLITIGQKIA